MGDFTERVKRKNKYNLSKLPLTISAKYGLVDQITFFNKIVASTDMSNYYLLKKGEFAYNKSYSNDYPWGAIKRLDNYEQGVLSALYICFTTQDNIESDFILQYFESPKWHKSVSEIAVEGARNHGLLNISVQDFFQTYHYVPKEKKEQTKIATLLYLIDERISTQNKIIEKLETLIKGIRNDVFGKLRKSVGFNAMIGDVLSYEQPQSYLVEDTEYTNEGTPVLTANKAFVLGYTSEIEGIYDKGDCIIFDDFTLDCKYVDFSFKVKSSAIKILTAKNKELLRYTFEFLKYLDLSTEEHKRHYITETQNQEFILPTVQIVRTIAHAFYALSLWKETIVKQRYAFEKQKQYLLRQMFI
ncbi:hypothetical protein [Prevotella intermedia]|nr:hypothetical protein [Prevotella intermedia]PDP68336.1 hypothetical protein CLI70_06610 [Prevotella intermedia]